MMKNSLALTKIYENQYVHRVTHEVLEKSHYTENGVSIQGRVKFLVDGKWLFAAEVPIYREHLQKKQSSLLGSLQHIKAKIKEKNKGLSSKDRDLIGENEFDDKRDCYDKLQVHYDEQVDRYGPYCPITGLEFTFIRPNKAGRGVQPKNITNLSHDRMLNEYNYIKQNLLFTCTGWNLQRQDFSLKSMSILMPKPFFKNYIEILLERFPDQKYKVDQLTELENGAEHPQWGR